MKIVLAVLLMLGSQLSSAKVSWEEAILVEQQLVATAGIENVYQCTYSLLVGGTYRFSTRYKGSNCPYSLVVNIESGKWKERK